MSAVIFRRGGEMEKWLEAAFDYARAKDSVGWLLLASASGYLFWRIASKFAAVIGSTSRLVLARYDRLLSDWEAANRMKNEEIRAQADEIARLREELRQARSDAAAARDRRYEGASRRGRDRSR